MENKEAWKELDDIESLMEALHFVHGHLEQGREYAIGLADVEVDLLQKLVYEALKKEAIRVMKK